METVEEAETLGHDFGLVGVCDRCGVVEGGVKATVACGVAVETASLAAVTEPQPALEPYFDKILIERDPEKTSYDKGGKIVVSEHFKDANAQFTGTVIAVGFGRLRPDGSLTPLHTKVGDRVVFAEFAGKKLPDDFGQRVYVLREDEILGRVNA